MHKAQETSLHFPAKWKKQTLVTASKQRDEGELRMLSEQQTAVQS